MSQLSATALVLAIVSLITLLLCSLALGAGFMLAG